MQYFLALYAPPWIVMIYSLTTLSTKTVSAADTYIFTIETLSMTMHARWSVSSILWIYFMHPSGEEPNHN